MTEKDLKKDHHNDPRPSDQKNNDDFTDQKAFRWLSLGIEFAGVIAIFSYVGWLADQKLQHKIPWIMIIAFALAFIGMMYLIIKETTYLRK